MYLPPNRLHHGVYIALRYNDARDNMKSRLTPCESTSPSNSRTIAARENGREGGFGRASRYSGEVLSEWASSGGNAVLLKYGREYFSELRKRRKNYPKFSESPVIRNKLAIDCG
jgi:hypothetical protein